MRVSFSISKCGVGVSENVVLGECYGHGCLGLVLSKAAHSSGRVIIKIPRTNSDSQVLLSRQIVLDLA